MPPLLCLFPSLCATLASWHWPLTFKPQVIFFFPESVPNSPNMWLNHCPMHLIVVQSRSHGTPRTVAHQALLSMGFPRQGYWSGLLFPSPGKLPQPKDWTRISCIGSGSLPLSHLGRPLCIIYISPFARVRYDLLVGRMYACLHCFLPTARLDPDSELVFLNIYWVWSSPDHTDLLRCAFLPWVQLLGHHPCWKCDSFSQSPLIWWEQRLSSILPAGSPVPNTTGFKRYSNRDFLCGSVDKNLPADAGDTGSIPGLAICHNYWACTSQQEKPLQWEVCAPQHRVALARPQLEKA